MERTGRRGEGGAGSVWWHVAGGGGCKNAALEGSPMGSEGHVKEAVLQREGELVSA